MLFYNTLTRRKEEFTPLKKSEVGLYSCGPTVYNYAHLGNLRTYIFVDVLKRALRANGYRVKHIMNITDVGHLTSDADEGEDKLEKGAERERKTVWQVAEFYTKSFKRDLKRLNILPPTKWTKATAHIKDQIRLIKILEEKGFTYEGSRAVYFDVSKVPDYGKLAGLKLEEQIAGAGEREGAAVEVDKEKRHPHDFVLWFKRAGKYKNHTMYWSSPWGDGFPGWHIECSAMSMKYLGETFDIHAGAVDLANVHHTNEIAQSEAATGKPFVRFWLHGEFLNIGEGGKMAKSGENFITLQTLTDRGFNPLALRYLALTAHYRSPLAFTWEALKAAENGLQNLYLAVAKVLKGDADGTAGKTKGVGRAAGRYREEFLKALDDDLNMPACLAVLWALVRDPKLSAVSKRRFLKELDSVLGLDFLTNEYVCAKIPRAVRDLVAERETMREKRQFREADALRRNIESLGYLVEDTPRGPFVFRERKKTTS